MNLLYIYGRPFYFYFLVKPIVGMAFKFSKIVLDRGIILLLNFSIWPKFFPL
jgi:hypothetical protein